MKTHTLPILALIAASHALHAAAMVPLAATGWNQDIVVGAGETAASGTTASMDSGAANTGGSWYGVGHNAAAPTTGLPIGVTTSETTPADLTFQLQPFNANNAVLNGGTLALVTPTPLSRLALIGSTGNGNATLVVTVNFSDGLNQVFNLVPNPAGTDGANADWFARGPIAYSPKGRLTVTSGNFDNVNSSNPRLYQSVLDLTNTSNVTSIGIVNSGAGFNAIMAISGEVIPEPTAALLGSLGALVFLRRRR